VHALGIELYGSTPNERMEFNMISSILLIEFNAWWEALGIHKLWKGIEQHMILFRYPKMYLGSQI